jgi:hypothetical protein
VKVLFAEQAGKDELLATLASIRTDAEQALEHHRALAADLATTGGPFPERLHVNALVFKFMWEQADLLRRWAVWAEDDVSGWPGDVAKPAGDAAANVLREAAGL